MKYKVGDKVRVRSDLVANGDYGGWRFEAEMVDKKGMILTVDSIDSDDYYIMDDGSEYWTDEMLEDVEEEFQLPEKWCIKLVGDEVVSYTNKYGVNPPYNSVPYHLAHFPQFNGCTTFNQIEKGYVEITFDQFKKYVLKESESTSVKEEVKFEAGKWYKSNIGSETFYYIKVNHFNGSVVYGERICPSHPAPEVYIKDDYWDSAESINQALKIGPLTDLSEIQRYLPENHPDKIKRKTKKVEDLKYPDAVHCSSKEQNDKVKQFVSIGDYKGDYYYLLDSQSRRKEPWTGACASNLESRTTYANYEFSDIIFPEEKIETKPKLSKEELLAEAKRRYPVGTRFCNSNIIKNCKLIVTVTGHKYYSNTNYANDLLIDSSACNSSDECSSYTIYLNGDWAEIISKPTVEEEVIDVPEYIECIEGFSDYIIPGLIYKVIDKTHVDSIMLRCNITSNLSAGSNLYVSVWSFAFKPSTKEAFDKQSKSSVKEKEELVQTGMSQRQVCDSCKYNGEECAKRKSCDATGGQHYPKDNSSERYIVAVDPFDVESSSDGTEVGKLPLNRGMGLYEQMEKIHMIEMASKLPPMEWIYSPYNQADFKLETIDSDEIYVPIIKTEVKQIKL